MSELETTLGTLPQKQRYTKYNPEDSGNFEGVGMSGAGGPSPLEKFQNLDSKNPIEGKKIEDAFANLDDSLVFAALPILGRFRNFSKASIFNFVAIESASTITQVSNQFMQNMFKNTGIFNVGSLIDKKGGQGR